MRLWDFFSAGKKTETTSSFHFVLFTHLLYRNSFLSLQWEFAFRQCLCTAKCLIPLLIFYFPFHLMQIWCRKVQSAANMLSFIFQLSAGVLHIFCRVGRKMWSNKWEIGASGRSIAKFHLQSWWRSYSYPFHYSYRYISICVSMHMRHLPFRFTWNAGS